MGDPLSELSGVWDGGWEKNIVDIVRQQDDRLLPDDAALLVPHVVDLVEDDPTDLARNFGASIQHRSQDLRRHDQARRRRVDRHIAGDQAHVGKLFVKFSILQIIKRIS